MKTEVTRLSDNLLAPKEWVAEIRKYPDGRVEYAVQFVGQDEGRAAEWKVVETVSAARKAIAAAVQLHNARNETRDARAGKDA